MQVTSGSTAGATGVASDSSSLVMTSGAEGSLDLAVATGVDSGSLGRTSLALEDDGAVWSIWTSVTSGSSSVSLSVSVVLSSVSKNQR